MKEPPSTLPMPACLHRLTPQSRWWGISERCTAQFPVCPESPVRGREEVECRGRLIICSWRMLFFFTLSYSYGRR